MLVSGGALSRLEVTVSMGGARSQPKEPPPPATVEHTWEITSGGRTYDALDLADEVIDAWDDWLRSKGLV